MRKYLLSALLALGPTAAYAHEGNGRESDPVEAGFDALALARVDSAIARAISDGATPGAALAVGRAGRLVRLRGYGRLDWALFSGAVTDSTLYDLASLTKVIGTTTAALQLVHDGQLGLEDRVADHLSFWPRTGRHGEIRIRHLLQHSSGLPAGAPIWTAGGTREQRIAQLAKLRLQGAPGSRREYSDVGMILLGAVIEKVTGLGLDQYVDHSVALPLGLRETGFNPLGRFSAERIAPTERMRNGDLLLGSVHDRNAAALSGVAGHSGLFGSARDLARFAAAMLDAAQGRENALFANGAFAPALQMRAFGRPLGWDAPTGLRSSAGHYFSAESFGHTGFTGTSIWIDPQQDLFVVLLTNRLNPTAANQKHVALRRAVHDAVQLAIQTAPPLAVPLHIPDPPAQAAPIPIVPLRVVSAAELERLLRGVAPGWLFV